MVALAESPAAFSPSCAELRVGPFAAADRERFELRRFGDLVPEVDVAVLTLTELEPELLVWAFDEALARGIELIVAECAVDELNDWARLGFRPYGLRDDATRDARARVRVRVGLVLGDLGHARRCGSPLAEMLAARGRRRAWTGRLARRLARCPSVASQRVDAPWFRIVLERFMPSVALAYRLGELSADQLDALLDGAHVLDAPAAAKLIRPGRLARSLYVLLGGSLVVHERGRIVARISEPGATVGEVRMSDVLAGPDGAQLLVVSLEHTGEVAADDAHGPEDEVPGPAAANESLARRDARRSEARALSLAPGCPALS